MCVINVANIVWIGQTIVTHFARLPEVDAHRVGHFVQPFGSSMGRSDVADGSNHRVPEKLVDSSSAQVVLDAPVH